MTFKTHFHCYRCHVTRDANAAELCHPDCMRIEIVFPVCNLDMYVKTKHTAVHSPYDFLCSNGPCRTQTNLPPLVLRTNKISCFHAKTPQKRVHTNKNNYNTSTHASEHARAHTMILVWYYTCNRNNLLQLYVIIA